MQIDPCTAESSSRKAASAATHADGGIAPALLAWFDRCGRKHLPWQQNPTAYRVWVSEIMLQQTQVVTVIPYYERFMGRFAEVRALAAAPIDEVLHLWTGLGYYARARNLHRAAQCIVDEHGGEFPQTLEAMQALPGIGRSTAGAILALSGAQRHPILDGNVKRVLTRCFGVDGFPGQPATERELWTLADACTPHERVASYTQAIMDLGATVCVRARPLCAVCPLSGPCIARRDGLQSVLPAPRPKKARPQRTAFALLALCEDGSVLLERRPPTGLWGGLWTLPQFDDRATALAWLQQRAGNDAVSGEASSPAASLGPYSHSFTHFDLTLHPIVIHLRHAPPSVTEGDQYCWFNPEQPLKVGLAKPTVALMKLLRNSDEVMR